jgi:hypothetical protein
MNQRFQIAMLALLISSGCGVSINGSSGDQQPRSTSNPCDELDRNLVTALRIVLENDYLNGFTRDEVIRGTPAACAANEQRAGEQLTACIACVATLVDEIWVEPVTRTARQICRRAGFDEIAIDGIFHILELGRAQGFTRADFLPAIAQCEEPDGNSRCVEEGGRLDECIAACTSCMIAAIKEVFH